MSTKKQKEHYDKLARFGCVLCFYLGLGDGTPTPAEIHHIRTGNIPRKDAPVIPLCPEHHRGNTGFHGLGRRRFEAEYDITQEDLLEIVNDAINYHWEIVDENTMIGSRIQ